MLIKRIKGDEFEIKIKETTVRLDGGIKVGEVTVDSPGEYEVGGVFIDGIASGEETVYLIGAEDMNICFLGQLKASLTSEASDEISDVDILFLPAGGEGTLDLKKATSLLQEIDPKIVIPIYLTSEEEFLKAEGETAPRREKTLKIATANLPTEEDREVILLN